MINITTLTIAVVAVVVVVLVLVWKKEMYVAYTSAPIMAYV